MPTIQEFLKELDHESIATRQLLERVPADRYDWRPHPKSMTLGQLAQHIAQIPGFISATVKEGVFEPSGNRTQGQPESAAALLSTFDASMASARDTIGSMTDADLTGAWRMIRDGKEMAAMPRSAAMRNLLLNHWYHHRGQLTVYLRLNDVALPSVYGPTADLKL